MAVGAFISADFVLSAVGLMFAASLRVREDAADGYAAGVVVAVHSIVAAILVVEFLLYASV